VILSPLLRRLYIERFWLHTRGTVKHLDGSISTNPRRGIVGLGADYRVPRGRKTVQRPGLLLATLQCQIEVLGGRRNKNSLRPSRPVALHPRQLDRTLLLQCVPGPRNHRPHSKMGLNEKNMRSNRKHAPLAIERDMPANPKAGRALLRRLPMEERFGMAQFSHLLGATELTGVMKSDRAMPTPAAVKHVPLLLTLTLRRRQWE